MRRHITYPGQIPLDTDLLYTNRETMIALGYFVQAVLGTSTWVDGLACTPTSPASMTVNIAPGSIYTYAAIDNSAYGSIAADTTHTIMKQGLLYDTASFTLAAPTTSGYSINYLIQGSFSEIDGGSTVLPYYNSAAPATAWSGPSNSGAAQNTYRTGSLVLSTKAGAAASTGTQVTPTADTGCVPIWVVTVSYGATTITAAGIAQHGSAPIFTKLPYILSAISGYLPLAGGTMTGLANLAAGFRGPLSIVSTTTTLTPAILGGFVEITAASTVVTTLPTPVGSSGAQIVVWNQSATTQTLSTPAGAFYGPGITGAMTTLALPAGQSIALESEGANWLGMGGSYYVYAQVLGNFVTATTYRNKTAGKILTTDGAWGGMAPVTLTDAATIAVDLSTGYDFAVTLGGNRTMGTPANAVAGQKGHIVVTQDGTGSRTLAWASGWKFTGGAAPTLSTAAGAVDVLYYDVLPSGSAFVSFAGRAVA